MFFVVTFLASHWPPYPRMLLRSPCHLWWSSRHLTAFNFQFFFQHLNFFFFTPPSFGRSLWTLPALGGVFLSALPSKPGNVSTPSAVHQPLTACGWEASGQMCCRYMTGVFSIFYPPPPPLPPPPLPLLLSAKDYRAGRKFSTHL